MSIHALPALTVRQIGSAQVLADPSSVVKELLDNALDARATAVSVEIHSNTLDVIQVRDNGHGIAPEDRPLLCRRYCTSKIRAFDELKELGGRSLGFRGEALASMVEMSGGLSVLTRVDGEAVAVCLKIARTGEVEGQEPASHPVGTTVRVTNFLSTFPVRKQTALKNAAKCLGKIQRLLKAYALARPTVRLSLRVLKAKNEKGNWMYAPKPGAGIEDAALKVVGKECASQCAWSTLQSAGFEIQAFLPRLDADCAKISGGGQYISVDSRPVSAARGTLKQIVTLFKEILRRANSELSDAKDPFICMNVVCPPGSYDPNVEPAKDDVLFDDSSALLAVIEKLLETVYPTSQATQAAPTVPKEASMSTDRPSTTGLIEPHIDDIERSAPSAKRRRTWRSNMYGCDEEDLETMSVSERSVEEQECEDFGQALHDVAVSNPWTIARMNTSIKNMQSSPASNGQLRTPLRERRIQELNVSPPARLVEALIDTQLLPLTPQTSSPLDSTSLESRPGDDALRQNIQRLPLVRRDRVPSPSRQALNNESGFMSAHQTVHNPTTNISFGQSLALGTPLSAIPQAPVAPRRNPPRKQQQNVNKPYVPPVQDPSVVWFRNVPSSQQPRASPRKHPQDIQDLGSFTKHARPPPRRPAVLDAANALVERESPARNRDIRDFIPASELLSPPPTLDRNRSMFRAINSAPEWGIQQGPNLITAGLQVEEGSLPTPGLREATVDTAGRRRKTTENQAVARDIVTAPQFENEDYEATGAQARHRRTTDDTRSHPQRGKSARLPLERVPANSHMQNVKFDLQIAVSSISKSLRKLDTVANFIDWDLGPECAYDAFAIQPTDKEVRTWTARLESLLRSIYSEQDMWGELRLGLGPALARHREDELLSCSATV